MAKLLTISLWQSFARSLSNFVLPHPGPLLADFAMLTYLLHAIVSSSSTCFKCISVLGSSHSIMAYVSDNPSS